MGLFFKQTNNDNEFIKELNDYYNDDEQILACNYFFGKDGYEINVPKALGILYKGINYCDGSAMHTLGIIDMIGAPPYVMKNIDAGIEKLIHACRMGHDFSFMALLSIYRQGLCPEVSDEPALKEYIDLNRAGEISIMLSEEAINAQKGDLIHGLAACYNGAIWAYLNGYGTECNLEKAQYWLSVAKSIPLAYNPWTRTLETELNEKLNQC